MASWFKFSVLVCALLLGGCGGGVKEEVSTVIRIEPSDRIKLVMNGIAETGAELGSGEESLRETLEELRQTDSAKAAAIDPEFEKLVKARDASSRKTAAKAVLSKL